jgi:hypothetical protein
MNSILENYWTEEEKGSAHFSQNNAAVYTKLNMDSMKCLG